MKRPGQEAVDAAEAGVGPEGEDTPRPEGRAPEGVAGGGKDAESIGAVGTGGKCDLILGGRDRGPALP